MSGSGLRTYVLGLVVSLLIGTGIGFGWHYVDRSGGRAVASAVPSTTGHEAPNTSSSNLPVQRQGQAPDVARGGTLPAAQQQAGGSPRAHSCCKVCTKGKACGDTCISRARVCHAGSGCACDR